MTSSSDPHDLERFVRAQEPVYEQALLEIQHGRKRSHWMWYLFPQVHGLGMSATSRRYAIKSREEAAAYLAHPLLEQRLVTCTKALLEIHGMTATAIFGSPDDLKLRSSATLFAAVSPPGSIFQELLERYYRGEPDPRTLELLERTDSTSAQ
jgi:uncharacterized protein (DUF1810 family)